MSLLPKAAFATLLLGTIAIAPAYADDTGCPPGLHRADSEGGMNNATRRADSEGGQNNALRRADLRAVRTTPVFVVPTLRSVKATRFAKPIPRAAVTTPSAALKRKHPPRRQRLRLVSSGSGQSSLSRPAALPPVGKLDNLLDAA